MPDYINASYADVRGHVPVPSVVDMVTILTGIQTEERLPHSPGSHAVHHQRLLEADQRQGVWCDSDAIGTGGGGE